MLDRQFTGWVSRMSCLLVCIVVKVPHACEAHDGQCHVDELPDYWCLPVFMSQFRCGRLILNLMCCVAQLQAITLPMDCELGHLAQITPSCPSLPHIFAALMMQLVQVCLSPWL